MMDAAGELRHRSSVADLLIGTAAGAIAFAAYVRTMYPGLVGVGDAAKFAFVGRVLGTPHAPGYPLYVLVSHFFSYVPWGSLAHRMNGFSALLAAVAVALAYGVARILGMERSIAAGTALALGFGRAFWSKAEYPKTYTLNAALVTLGLLLLVGWGHEGRRSLLFGAIACFAISVGNHLIIVALLPALLMYAVLTDARTALAPRTILISLALLALGFSQYLLILVRTWQNAPYLEARAETFGQLLDILTLRRWSQEIGAYSWRQVVAARIPIISSLVVRELTAAGLVLAALGTLRLLRLRWRDALLCVIGAAGVLTLTVNMSSNEDEGFLLPAFLLLWLLAGFGLQWIADLVRSGAARAGRLRASAAAAMPLLIAAAVPVWLLASNYAVNNHHDHTFETRYFDALFRILPRKTALLDDRYPVNMMVKYKLLGEDAAAGRHVVVILPTHTAVENWLANGYSIFAFDEGRSELQKFGYEFEPVQLLDTTLPEYLDLIRDGSIGAIAATPDVAAQLRTNRAGWRRFGVPEQSIFGRKNGAPLAIVGVKGVPGTAAEADGVPTALVEISKGAIIGRTNVRAPVSFRVRAERDAALITIDGVPAARVTSGAVAVSIDPRGHIETHVFDPLHDLRMPFDMSALPLFRLTATAACNDIGNVGWRNISASVHSSRIAVRIDNYRAFLSRTTFYIGADRGIAPQLTLVGGHGTPNMSVDSFRMASAEDRQRLEKTAAADGFADADRLTGSPFVARVELDVNDKGDFRAMQLEFASAPTAVYVRSRVDLNNPRRAVVCGVSPATPP
jgi:hypothetical protein